MSTSKITLFAVQHAWTRGPLQQYPAAGWIWISRPPLVPQRRNVHHRHQQQRFGPQTAVCREASDAIRRGRKTSTGNHNKALIFDGSFGLDARAKEPPRSPRDVLPRALGAGNAAHRVRDEWGLRGIRHGALPLRPLLWDLRHRHWDRTGTGRTGRYGLSVACRLSVSNTYHSKKTEKNRVSFTRSAFLYVYICNCNFKHPLPPYNGDPLTVQGFRCSCGTVRFLISTRMDHV